jgi:FtsP/CotA-like multicopper oxidase with cupredoxin domain
MSNREHRSTRREFLRSAGLGAAGLAIGGGLVDAAVRTGTASASISEMPPTYLLGGPVDWSSYGGPAAGATQLALAATDGHIDLPNLPARPSLEENKLYVFGFRGVQVTSNVGDLTNNYKGHVQHTAPIIVTREVDPAATTTSGGVSHNPLDVTITLTNLGFQFRPDLFDSHTIHWHGFRAPETLFDGVPEVSIAVPEFRQFPYFYRPHDPGTYMYHCHFDDVEHVQMGMTSIVFVRPRQEVTNPGLYASGKFVYNDGDGSTGFDREFAMLLNELWQRIHDRDELIQETIFTDYDANFFTLNGRVYPDTLAPNGFSGPNNELRYQPTSSLVQCNGAERVLLRLANLGYQRHAMQLPGIQMKVVGQDATLLRGPTGWAALPSSSWLDLSYSTDTLYIGPGEARDVIFTAPAYDPGKPGATDTNLGPYNYYFFKNADAARLQSNGGPPGGVSGVQGNDPGLGGMATEVRVYQNPLDPSGPKQPKGPNQTYPV